MKNIFKKLFKGEARLVSEWPPPVTETKRDLENRLRDLRAEVNKLEGVHRDQDQELGEWVADDVTLLGRLKADIAEVETKLGIRSAENDTSSSEKAPIQFVEDLDVKARVDEFTRKIRGSGK